jgi:MFS family permease
MAMSAHREEIQNSRHVHPWIFMVLEIPYGVVSGYVTVTLSYQLKQAGASVEQIAALVALGVLPHTWKFFWAPVIDLTLNQKKWYLLTGILTAIGLAAMGFFPATKSGLAALSAVVFLTSLATTFLGMSLESLLAYSTPIDLKGRAAGWFQAGSLGGAGIGGGLGLFLVQKLPAPWMASCIVGGLCMLCSAALLAIPTPVRHSIEGGIFSSLAATIKDLWQVIRKRAGALALLVALLPIATGAINFAAIADEWKASADTVALVTGVLSGLICAAGCLAGGWVCDRMDRKAAYIWFGIFQAVSGIMMALLPRTPAMYVILGSVYGFTNGLTYAAFSAFVLEAIGKGAAATKYNAFASLSNVPIYFMTRIDGWSHDRWNSKSMFFLESGLAVLSALVFIAAARLLWREPARA